MNKGVEPNPEPLTDEEVADVLAGHPHPEASTKIKVTAEGRAHMGQDHKGDAGIGGSLEVGGMMAESIAKALNVDHKDPYVTEMLNRMAELYAERNAVYKDNYKKVGAVMVAMFPEGKVLKTAEDFNKWHLFELAIVKLTRYANQYEEGHMDSLEDLIVYMAMVAGIDNANSGS
jgi:hypothetical protein